MVRYIYGHPVNSIPLTQLYETYTAGDKYLVCDLSHRLIETVKNSLSESNCCIVYNELIKFSDYDELIERAKRLIRSETKVAFEDELFECLDRDSLVDILNFEWLGLEEIKILGSCLRWVEADIERMNLVQTGPSKRKVFTAIKHHIPFSDMTPEELGTFEGIENLLNIVQ